MEVVVAKKSGRIEGRMTPLAALDALTMGNIQASRIGLMLLSIENLPSCFQEGMTILQRLDDCRIYGADIVTLYEAVCDKNVTHLLRILIACKGDARSRSRLRRAIEAKANLKLTPKALACLAEHAPELLP